MGLRSRLRLRRRGGLLDRDRDRLLDLRSLRLRLRELLVLAIVSLPTLRVDGALAACAGCWVGLQTLQRQGATDAKLAPQEPLAARMIRSTSLPCATAPRSSTQGGDGCLC